MGRGKRHIGRIDRTGAWITESGLHPGMYTQGFASSSGLVSVRQTGQINGCLDRHGKWIEPLGEWNSVSLDQANVHDGEKRYWLVYMEGSHYSFMAEGWSWLAGAVPFLRDRLPQKQEIRRCLVHDSLTERVIWTSDDRAQEIWWGAGLVAVSAGTLFMGWWRRRRPRS